MPWPCTAGPLGPGVPSVQGCHRAGWQAGGCRKGTTDLWQEPVPWAYGCGDARGDPAGLRRMGKQPLLFKTVDSSPETSWWQIFATCLSRTGTQTEAAGQSTPDLALAGKAPARRGEAQSVQEALGGLRHGTAVQLPVGPGPQHHRGREGLKQSETTNPKPQDCLRSPGNTQVLLEPSPIPPGQPLVTAGQGEPLQLETPRMS